MTAMLTVEGLKVHFGGVRAVDGVDLELEQGRLYGLVGPNGSGKTTLVNAITRVGPTTAGRIVLEGRDITNARGHELVYAGLARTFQAIRLVPSLTVRENVLLGRGRHVGRGRGAGLRGRRAAAARAARAADAAIEKLRLGPVADEYPANLPYGTQRRVEIAGRWPGTPSSCSSTSRSPG
jgi:ABC-type branched-subunit amino acid transport system ATPase component